MAVPLILHQTYSSLQRLPELLRLNCEAIRARNADCDYRFYEDSDRQDFILTHYGPEMLKRYLRIDSRYGAARADFFRYLCVYQVGGIYLDVKADPRIPLSQVIRPDDAYILAQWDQSPDSPFQGWGSHAELAGFPGGTFQQWFLIASPKHPFLESVIKRVAANIDSFNPWPYWRSSWSAVVQTTGEIPYSQAIIEGLSRYPHRVVSTDRDLGLHYSIYVGPGALTAHHGSMRHYSFQDQPLVVQQWPLSWMFAGLAFARDCFRRLRRARSIS